MNDEFKRAGSPVPIQRSSFIVHRSVEAEAEACFLKAIEIARHQRAKSWELRAVMSLARLWLRQGKKAEARQRLTEVYGWFTEGLRRQTCKRPGCSWRKCKGCSEVGFSCFWWCFLSICVRRQTLLGLHEMEGGREA